MDKFIAEILDASKAFEELSDTRGILIAKLEAEKAVRDARIAQLEAENAEREAENARNARIAQLEAENSKLKVENAQLEAEKKCIRSNSHRILDSQAHEIENARIEKDKLRKKNDELLAEIQRLRDIIVRKSEEAEGAAQAAKDAAVLATKLADMETEESVLRIRSLIDTCNAFQKQIDELSAELRESEYKVKALEEQVEVKDSLILELVAHAD